MVSYQNLSGNSGVVTYETGPGWITVQFRDGAVYRYDEQSVGGHLGEMQHLARAGRGLNTFISQVVRDRYAQKLR